MARAEVSFGARLERRLPRPLRTLIDELEERDVLLYASGLAFYALVSIAPLVIVIMWIVAALLGDERVHRLADELKRVAPDGLGADQALKRVADLGTQIGLPAVAAALWPATAYGAGLSRAFLRLAPGAAAKGRAKSRGLRGRILAFLLLLPAFAVGGLLASYLGTQALGSSTAGAVLGPVIALGTGFVAAFAAIALIYRVFPPDPLQGGQILRATLFTAAGVSVLSLGMSLYLAFGANFQERYATSGIAGIVLLALWLFGTNTLLLLGYRMALRTPQGKGGTRTRRRKRASRNR